MDKNIAALMREDTRTVHVNFDVSYTSETRHSLRLKENAGNTPKYVYENPAPEGKTYTYVTDLPVARGDLVVVEASGVMKLATVIRVDDEVDIEPNSAVQYKWIVSIVDLEPYVQTLERNKLITDAVGVAYKNNLRRTFAQQILSGVDGEVRLKIENLIKAK